MSKDKVGGGSQIEYFDNCNNTDLVPYYHKMMNEFHASGFATHRTICFSYSQKAFAAFNEAGEVVGMVLFEDEPWKNAVCVVHGHVDKDYRRQGIYTRLWNSVVEKAQEWGRYSVEGATHHDNLPMLAVMSKLGRKPTFTFFTFPVPATKKTKKGKKK